MSRQSARPRKFVFLGASLSLALPFLAGCHSRFVETDIDNQGKSAVHMVEVDYPSASFGVGNLAANSRFHYRFKIQGSGPLKLEFTDSQGQVHNVEGPNLTEGQEGHVNIAIGSDGKVTWQPNLVEPK